MLVLWEITAGDLLVGLGTLALAVATFLLVIDERKARKEHSKPKFGLTGSSYVLNLDIPRSLWLKCLSGVAKEVRVEYKYENRDAEKKYAFSLAKGESIVLDREFIKKYEKGGMIKIKVSFKYDSNYDTEDFVINIEDIKTGKFDMPSVTV